MLSLFSFHSWIISAKKEEEFDVIELRSKEKVKLESGSSPLLFVERLQERERPKKTVNIFLSGYPLTEWLIL